MSEARFLEIRDVTMAFPGVVALENVSVAASRGEILGVVGENGAGKSTLMKILAGVHPSGSYQGDVLLEAVRLDFDGVADAEAVGIVLIPQELNVVPEFTVAEYIFLNREPRRFLVINRSEMVEATIRLLADFDLDISPDTPMKALGTAQQQLVEIVRALSKNARVVILDEPTASLSVRESSHLFERLRDLKRRGVTCLYVSHRLSEVLALADRVFVLRDGRPVGLDDSAGLSHARVVSMMLGRDLEDLFPKVTAMIGETLLELVDFGVRDPEAPEKRIVEGVNLELRAGEVLGLFGLVGAGRTELVMALFGAWPLAPDGDVRVRGRSVRVATPEQAISAGIALLTEDRKRYGLIPAWDVEENITLASLAKLSRVGLLRRDASRELAEHYVQSLGIKSRSLREPALNLSGGNQQKVILGRWLARAPQVLVLDEPTRGIDVGAKVEVFRLLNRLTREGLGVLFISSELEEILGMSDRILVMTGGRIAGEWSRDDATEEIVLARAMGAAA
jgi:ABC-type sugar transport system ATPase subunit